MKHRTVFFGTPSIAVPAFQALTEITDVVSVVCQPDRPSGRGMELKPPAVKVAATNMGIPILQPEKIRTPEFQQWFAHLKPDAAIVMAYGRILPKPILDTPRLGCINLHASILPKYRGAAPIQWAILQGEPETGISLMQMDEGCDTGPVFSRHAIAIDFFDTSETLSEKLAQLGEKVVHSDLLQVLEGHIQAVAQQHELATNARILTKEDGRIQWSQSSFAIHNHIRAMTPWPSAFTLLHHKMFKILQAKPIQNISFTLSPATVHIEQKKKLWVGTLDGAIEILQAQLEGRKALSAAELIAGRVVESGTQLGS